MYGVVAHIVITCMEWQKL